MKAKTIILGAATLSAFAWLLNRKKEAGSVSRVGKLANGQQFVRRAGDLAELYRTGRKGQLNNGDIVFDFDTARISENIRRAAEAESVLIPAETDNLRDIRRAYKYSKRADGGAIWQTTGRLGFEIMRNYHHLTASKRGEIQALKAAGATLKQIADFIGCDTSTVCRELKRNGGKRSYNAERRKKEQSKIITDFYDSTYRSAGNWRP